MAVLIDLPRVFDANGDPVSGAKANTYETGTTTPETTYTDSALTTPHANPIVSDSQGYFAEAFYDGATALRVVITDADDVTLVDLDPCPTSGIGNSAAASVSFNPTGSIPSTTVQAAIEKVQSNISSTTANGFTLVATAGSSNTYTLTASTTITAYATGQRFLARANHSNTGAATLNVDSVGAKDIQKYNASGSLVALASGDIKTGDIIEVTYDGTRFVLINRYSTQSAKPGFEFIETQDASASGTLDFTSFDATKYDGYVFVLGGVKPATDSVELRMRFSTDGGSSYISTASYQWRGHLMGVGTDDSASGQTSIQLTETVGGDGVGSAGSGVHGEIWMPFPHLALETHINTRLSYTTSAPGFASYDVMAVGPSGAVDAVRFLFTSGNIASGTITMYGLRNSA